MPHRKDGGQAWKHNQWRRQEVNKVTLRSMGRRAGALQSHGICFKFLLLLNNNSVSVVPYLQDVTQSQSLLLLFGGDFGTFYVQEDVPFSPSLKMEGRNKISVRHELLEQAKQNQSRHCPQNTQGTHLLPSSASFGPSHVTAAPRADFSLFSPCDTLGLSCKPSRAGTVTFLCQPSVEITPCLSHTFAEFH